MEYRGIWIVFLTLWFLLGVAVAVFPVAVARLLRRKRDLPPSRLLTAGRIIGVVVAVGSLAKLFSVLTGRWATHPGSQ
jgi:hypothetical protein